MKINSNEKFSKLCSENKTIWMGIINTTPDSFSDGGDFLETNQAFEKCMHFAENGVNILDIGGVSTKPFAEEVSWEEELKRVYPLLKKLKEIKKSFPNLMISVDSSSPKVTNTLAEEKLIDIINDVYSASKFENVNLNKKLAYVNNFDIASFYNLPIIIMHMLGKPKTMQIDPKYENIGEEIFNFLNIKIIEAKNKGINSIILDPGIGFGKSVEDNLYLISAEFIDKLKQLDKPILIGLSRKAFIGKLFPNLKDPKSRDLITKNYEEKCIQNGVKIIRTHVMPLNK